MLKFSLLNEFVVVVETVNKELFKTKQKKITHVWAVITFKIDEVITELANKLGFWVFVWTQRSTINKACSNWTAKIRLKI